MESYTPKTLEDKITHLQMSRDVMNKLLAAFNTRPDIMRKAVETMAIPDMSDTELKSAVENMLHLANKTESDLIYLYEHGAVIIQD